MFFNTIVVSAIAVRLHKGCECKRHCTPEQTREGSPWLQAHCWEEPGLSKKKKKEKKGKQERKCNCRRCEMLCFCWEGAVAHCLGDATLQHHKQQLLHVAGIQLSPNGCKDREQCCSSARLCFVYAYKSELRGLGFLVDFFCYLRSVRTSAPCSTFLLHPVMLTYTRIHLDFRRTSSHGGRAAGYFLRCCRYWWLSFR